MTEYDKQRQAITAPTLNIDDGTLAVDILRRTGEESGLPAEVAFQQAIRAGMSPATSPMLSTAIQQERQLRQAEADEAARTAWEQTPEARTLKAESAAAADAAKKATAAAARALMVEEGHFSASTAAEIPDDEILVAAGLEAPALEGQAARIAAEDARWNSGPQAQAEMLRASQTATLYDTWWNLAPDQREAHAIELGLDPNEVHARMRLLAGMD